MPSSTAGTCLPTKSVLASALVDEHGMAWDEAWDLTRRTFSYTNHTLLPEAMEKWSLDLFGSLLPRHLEIIFELNRRFLDQVRITYPTIRLPRRRMNHLLRIGR